MKTIILKDNEVLRDTVYGNKEFKVLIHVKGDNVVIDNILVFSPKKDFKRVIKVTGKNCLIKNSRFQDIGVTGAIIETKEYTIIQECLFMNGRKADKKLEAILLSNDKNILIGNRFDDWDRGLIKMSNNNLLINNEIVNCRGNLTLKGKLKNVLVYNYIDGKMKKDSGCIIMEDNNVIKNNTVLNLIRGYKNIEYKHHTFVLKPFDELKKEVVEYKEPEPKEEKKEEPIEEKIPDITVKDFMDKLLKKMRILAFTNRMERVKRGIDKNLDEFRELMKEMRELTL